ncbi:MAG: hypothetical protein DWQ31_15335 [Planctomycetota bacterium]|nr:MAG: hypothetical protein DWQ31_15335 [Planctomycetota bacterium]REJ87427.1 MAG: hypothetical protein DWQ35_21450 [Planctomycetota bacterium]REK30781.1 MAG: hypothetical protein DWQ42_01470 [Planctomycetota bacterium]REK42161.1 MAG: hypothetical protein DWQ46_14350 [Planctomycetota bacterium]
MIRAVFIAIGVCLILVGLECLIVDKAYLEGETMVTPANFFSDAVFAPRREFAPPRWAPFSLIAAGAVVMLYSFSIPRRIRG